MDWLQLICGVITIIGAMYGFMRFLLKDTHKQLLDLEEEQKEHRKWMREANQRMERIDMRLDGLYKVLLDKTYGIGKG